MLSATSHTELQKNNAEDKAKALRQEVHDKFEGVLDEKLMEECQ